jgi:long-subunit fatty acid transport protein
VADDATATVANPAGLTLLVRPEVSVEGRFWNFSTLAPLRGRYSGTPTGVGYDTIQNIVEDNLDETSNAVSFLSVVIPKNRFAFAGYRQVQSGYRASYSSDGIFIFDDQLVTTTPGQGQDRLDPYTATMSLDVVNYGFSAAYRFAGGLALGGGLAISDFSIEALTNVFYLGLNPRRFLQRNAASSREPAWPMVPRTSRRRVARAASPNPATTPVWVSTSGSCTGPPKPSGRLEDQSVSDHGSTTTPKPAGARSWIASRGLR